MLMNVQACLPKLLWLLKILLHRHLCRVLLHETQHIFLMPSRILVLPKSSRVAVGITFEARHAEYSAPSAVQRTPTSASRGSRGNVLIGLLHIMHGYIRKRRASYQMVYRVPTRVASKLCGYISLNSRAGRYSSMPQVLCLATSLQGSV
jgi:hypothetical protein